MIVVICFRKLNQLIYISKLDMCIQKVILLFAALYHYEISALFVTVVHKQRTVEKRNVKQYIRT